MEKDITSRLHAYKRTGDYAYIWGIANDAEKADAIKAKADQLARKSHPYTRHKDKQIKAFTAALNNVDAKLLFNSAELVKDDSLSVDYLFNHLIGTPGNMVTPTEEEIQTYASATLSNYFLEHPTPTVKAHKYQKDSDSWFILLSDNTAYQLHAIQCDNGEYTYSYEKKDNMNLP